MAKWWDKTITLYNKYEDPDSGKINWFRFVLTDCFVKRINKKVTVNDVLLQTKETVVRVPENEAYIPPYEWAQIEDKSERFTLQSGDLIVFGEVDDVIDEYTSGKRSSDFISRHNRMGGCVTIQAFNINTMSGIGLPHYHIKGE